MELNVLAVGDVVAQAGLDCLRRRLPQLKRGVRRTFYRGQRGKRRGDRAVSQPGGGYSGQRGRCGHPGQSHLEQAADCRTIWTPPPVCSDLPIFSQKVPGRGYGVF